MLSFVFKVVESLIGYPVTGTKSFFCVLEGFSAPYNLTEIVDTYGNLNIALGSNKLKWYEMIIYPGTVVENPKIVFIEDSEDEEEKHSSIKTPPKRKRQ